MSRIEERLTFGLMKLPPELPVEYEHHYKMTVSSNIAAALLHTTFLFLFWQLNLDMLFLFNMGSILAYLTGIHFCRKGLFNASWILSSVELSLHAGLATSVLGQGAGFQWYIMIASVLWFFADFKLITKICFSIISIVALMLVIVSTENIAPTEQLSADLLSQIELMNTLFQFLILITFCSYYNHSVNTAKTALSQEFARSQALLYNTLPQSIADRLKNEELIADRFKECSVLFSDIVGFTTLSQKLPPTELVKILNEIFSSFDDLADHYDLEKIKTIGDAYMIASGIPISDPNHARKISAFALDMQAYIKNYRQIHNVDIALRIGIHSGPLVAGVLGKKKYTYDLWGTTVNTAARIEAHGLTDEIHISQTTHQLIEEFFICEARGSIDLKDIGQMNTWLLKAHK